MWLLSPLQALGAPQWQPYFEMDSLSLSETVPINAAFEEWKTGNFRRGERQWTTNWLELGVHHGPWSYALVQRYDYRLDFTKDASELYWQVANKRTLQTGQDYDVRVSAHALNARGVRVAHEFALQDKLQLKLGISLLQATYLIDGSLWGTAQALNTRDFDYDAFLDWSYSKDNLLDRVVDKPSGYGLMLDLGLRYEYGLHELQWQARDLPGWIYWQDVPYTTARGRSSRKHYDERGYVSIEPAVSGREGFHSNKDQLLSPRMVARWRYYGHPSWQPVVAAYHQYGQTLFSVGGQTTLASGTRLAVSYWPVHAGWEFNLGRADAWQIGLMADHYEWQRLRSLGVTLRWEI